MNLADEWSVVLEGTHEAVRAYARVEFETLARKVIHRLQRIPASGIYGDAYVYKTLWDEYCHEVQEGPHDLPGVLYSPASAWKMTLPPFIDDVIDRVPRHAAILLSIFAAWELDEHDTSNIVRAFWPEGIRRLLQDRLAEQAGMRNLHHLGPWRNY